ncbi:phage minor capsid protein [Lachnoclostridium sp. An14]|uniref:phage minor capsid protein n=1 Tax=Lachnoclostridium sp. An14 TaxID=1965562 RepID=UPI0013A68146|nr:phage minor capsid protein [Lachnoclostridium sp. An14]
MAIKLIRPPETKDLTLFLRQLFLRAERQIIDEITRKRAAGYVDYAEVAALERVQQILQNMQDECWEYVPEMIEKIFYRSDKDAAGYRNARTLTAPQTAAVNQLSYNLLGEIAEASETAYKTVQGFYTIARLETDPYRTAALTQVAQQEASGIGWTQTSARMARELKNQGITAFTDKAGRKWTLSDYCNMCARTTARQAEVAAVLTADDHDLWQIVKIGSTCPVCAPLEGRVYSKSGTNPDYPPLSLAFGKIDPAGAESLENTYLNIHPNCLVPGGSILCESLVSASRRYYTGNVITLITASGNKITITPNHPILTAEGFVAAGTLKEGDEIIEAARKYRRLLRKAPNSINIPTRVEEIFYSFIKTRGSTTFSMEGSPVQFHGDGISNRKVDIVFPASFGVGEGNIVSSEPIIKNDFPPAHLRWLSLLANSAATKVIIRALFPFYCFVSSFGFVGGIKTISINGKKLSDLRWRTTAGFSDLSIGHTLIVKFKKFLKLFSMGFKEYRRDIIKFPVSLPNWQRYSKFIFGVFKRSNRNVIVPGNLSTRDSFAIQRLKKFFGDDCFIVSKLTHIETSYYDGYVYNLETRQGYYVYNNIVTHNCLHSLVKYTTIGKTDKQIKRDRDFSDPALNPLNRDPRTKKQIKAYQEKERNRRKLLDDIHQWRRYRAVLGDKAYKTFKTFQEHKRADDDVYKKLQVEYQKQNREIKETLSDNEI